jgi:hypothetical protein
MITLAGSKKTKRRESLIKNMTKNTAAKQSPIKMRLLLTTMRRNYSHTKRAGVMMRMAPKVLILRMIRS